MNSYSGKAYLEKAIVEKKGSVLIVVDMQNDFIPGVSVSALPVGNADSLVKPINSCMADFDLVVATQDWHPKNHASFASVQGTDPFSVGILHGKEQVWWPDHCVAGSWGANLEPFLKTDKMDLILRKGTNPEVDSYSAFQENWGKNGLRSTTGLEAWLRARGVYKVFICGVAKDYCVRYTAEDSVAAGFKTFLFDSLTKAVNQKDEDRLNSHFKQIGVEIIW